MSRTLSCISRRAPRVSVSRSRDCSSSVSRWATKSSVRRGLSWGQAEGGAGRQAVAGGGEPSCQPGEGPGLVPPPPSPGPGAGLRLWVERGARRKSRSPGGEEYHGGPDALSWGPRDTTHGLRSPLRDTSAWFTGSLGGVCRASSLGAASYCVVCGLTALWGKELAETTFLVGVQGLLRGTWGSHG